MRIKLIYNSLVLAITFALVLRQLLTLSILGSTLSLVLSNTCTSTPNLKSLILGFLDGLPTGLTLLEKSQTYQTVLWFELHHTFLVVVDEAESSGFTTTEFGTESEDGD